MAPIAEDNAGQTREIWVVFDTNSILGDSASSLLNWGAKRLIEENPARVDLRIRWILPEVVKLERVYQMADQAKGYRSDHRSMVRFMGKGNEVGLQEIEERAESLAEAEITKFALQIVPADYSGIDWAAVVHAATWRQPPFKEGDNEEGFRDSLISETFFQIAENSPRDVNACYVVLVTIDKLLRRAVEARSGSADCLKVMSIEELKGLINSVLENVPGNLVERLRDLVSPLFYAAGDDQSLFFAEQIEARIKKDYATELASVPDGADSRVNGPWEVANPRFVRRDGDVFSWLSQIAVRSLAFRNVSPSIITGLGSPSSLYQAGSGQFGVTGSLSTMPEVQWPSASGTYSAWQSTTGGQVFYPPMPIQLPPSPIPRPTRELVSTGTSVFEVAWTVQISGDEKISSRQFGSIVHVGTYWN